MHFIPPYIYHLFSVFSNILCSSCKKLIIANLLLDCDPQIHTWVLSYTISHISTGAIFQYKGKSILTGLSDTIFSLQINFITCQIILVDF